MDRLVTPAGQGTSPAQGPLLPCEQPLRVTISGQNQKNISQCLVHAGCSLYACIQKLLDIIQTSTIKLLARLSYSNQGIQSVTTDEKCTISGYKTVIVKVFHPNSVQTSQTIPSTAISLQQPHSGYYRDPTTLHKSPHLYIQKTPPFNIILFT